MTMMNLFANITRSNTISSEMTPSGYATFSLLSSIPIYHHFACTIFRQTYRKLDGETTTKQVEDRHKQLYHFIRYLFEAIEFYGSRMKTNLTVYHGLSVVLHFGQFTAYFSQPVSTTTDFTQAQQFSQSTGIILQLKSGTNYGVNRNRIPKYLKVSWLSAFPDEAE